jgi:hypothetical protein
MAFLDRLPTSAPDNHLNQLVEDMATRLALVEGKLRDKDGQITTLTQTVQQATIVKDAQITHLQQELNEKGDQITHFQQELYEKGAAITVLQAAAKLGKNAGRCNVCLSSMSAVYPGMRLKRRTEPVKHMF